MPSETDVWNAFVQEAVNRQPEKDPAPPRLCADCQARLHPRRNARRCIPCAIAFDRAHHPRADGAAINTAAAAPAPAFAATPPDGGEYGECRICGEAITAPGVHFCQRQPATIQAALTALLPFGQQH